MTIAAQCDVHQQASGSGTRSRLWVLWLVVTGLWTVATLLRVERVWVPRIGWWSIIHGPWLWVSLGVPPFLFAAIIAVMAKRGTVK